MRIQSSLEGLRVTDAFVVAIVLVACFSALGTPLSFSQGPILNSTYHEGALPFSPLAPAWEQATTVVIPLSGQVVRQPKLPDPSIESLVVRSLHNGVEIAFLLEWKDSTKNESLTPRTFRDAAALAFPLDDTPAFSCMGQKDSYLNIWHWKADWQSDLEYQRAQDRDPQSNRSKDCGNKERLPGPCFPLLRFRRASSVEDLLAGGHSTLTSKLQQGLVQGDALWEQGHWKVVLKRAMQANDPHSAIFRPGKLQAVTFAAWDGGRGERGAKKAVGPWIQLDLDPVTQRIPK